MTGERLLVVRDELVWECETWCEILSKEKDSRIRKTALENLLQCEGKLRLIDAELRRTRAAIREQLP